MRRAAKARAACQPGRPMEPLPSRSTTTSSAEAQRSSVRLPGSSSWQSFSLQGLNCKRSLASAWGHLPSAAASFSTSRQRRWEPVSQALEQEVHSVQTANTQSLLQAWTLHGTASDVSAQIKPPFSASCVMRRTRSFTPPSHPALQELHSSHAAKEQSTGHACSLHGSTFASGPQAVPPCCGVTRCRLKRRVPPPQETEHSS
mmetsp:Transcript_59178/g.153848  ORF Transcript_59178/g.153848 Transcript_59178/m.153848 type:complete len:202 (-) Transcript_59178:507-1112(-)